VGTAERQVKHETWGMDHSPLCRYRNGPSVRLSAINQTGGVAATR